MEMLIVNVLMSFFWFRRDFLNPRMARAIVSVGGQR